MRRFWVLLTVPLLIACVLIDGLPSSGTVAQSNGTVMSGSVPVPLSEPAFTARAASSSGTVAHVIGCWNIRVTPSADGRIISVICDADVVVGAPALNGYVSVEGGGYICGRAVGVSAACRK